MGQKIIQKGGMFSKPTIIVNGGGSGGDSAALLAAIGIILAVVMVGAAVWAVVTAIMALLTWILVVFGVGMASLAVLAVVFRPRIGAFMAPNVGDPRARAELPPQAPRPVEPKQELHLHFHGDVDPRRAIDAVRAIPVHRAHPDGYVTTEYLTQEMPRTP